jgi:hypothetical protein
VTCEAERKGKRIKITAGKNLRITVYRAFVVKVNVICGKNLKAECTIHNAQCKIEQPVK